MILGEGGEKMSKSRGNVINPDDIVREIGADAFRLYEMFMGAFDQAIPWSTQGARGCRRFLERVWRLQGMLLDETAVRPELASDVNAAVKKVGEDYEKMKFNTAIAAMMALAIANVYVGKALDVHANDPLSRAECAASGSDATVEEYCLICHFHLAACTEAESFLPTLVTLFEERLYRCYLAGGSSPVLHGYGLRAPPAAV